MLPDPQAVRPSASKPMCRMNARDIGAGGASSCGVAGQAPPGAAARLRASARQKAATTTLGHTGIEQRSGNDDLTKPATEQVSWCCVPCDGSGVALHRDFRKPDPATQAWRRRVAVAVVEAGSMRVEAAAAVGVNRRFLGEWVGAALQLGDAALEARRRGRRPGKQKPLSPAQERRTRRPIAERCPDQLKPIRRQGTWAYLPVDEIRLA